MMKIICRKRLDAVVLSTPHDPEVTQEQIHEDIKKYVFDEIIPADMVDDETKFFINPTGRFVIGGPHGDSGLTGRKIIVDTYGGMARPRRRCILRKGLHKGGPFRCVCGALCSEEYCGSRACKTLRDPAFLCDWRGTADFDLC